MSSDVLADEIRDLCQRKLGGQPSHTGYNGKIQWLKLHDQMPEMVTACDKHTVRSMIPEEYLIPPASKPPMVVKCSHDSGGIMFCHSDREVRRAERRLTPRLAHKYGVGGGEWAYRLIEKPRLVYESLIPQADVDYKFHMVHGRVAWIQVIWNRRQGAIECILGPDCRPAGLHMDEKMRHSPTCPHTPDWSALIEAAERLSAPYRYVRVDLYWAGRVYFGELTFWPRAGCYKSKDEPIFGRMLGIDQTYKLPRIC
jgi:hypothetical protein